MAKLTAQDVKRQADIVQIVRSYGVELRQSGNELVGRSPLRDDDDTASFFVNPEKRAWIDRGLGKGGSVIDFVMAIEGVGFARAVKTVAERAGIVPAPSSNGSSAQATPPPQAPPKNEKPSQSKLPTGPEQLGPVVARYPYHDESGAVLYEVRRHEPKTFRPWTPDGKGGWICGLDEKKVRRVLYRLPEVLAAEEIFWVEGEKDVDALAARGLVATTIAGGAGATWHPQYAESVAGKRIVFLPDNDESGKKLASRVAKECKGRVAEFVIVDLPVPPKGDVSDYLNAGHTVEDLQAMVAAARRRIRIDQLNRQGLLGPREIIETIDGGLRALMKPPRGLSTGFPQFDNVTMGLHPGELVILAARPAMGKTAFALNVADYCAVNGKAVAVFSLEMSRASLLRRMLCSRARVDQMCLRAGVIDHDERQRFSRALGELADTRLRIDDTPLTIDGVKQRLARMREKLGLDLVIVDYLQLMPTGESRDTNRNNEVGFLSRELKLLAGELDVPFLVLSQLSRKPEERKNDHRPQLADLRDSGEIEQNADVVALLYRPEYYDRTKPELKGKAELIIAKHRNGPTEDIELHFYREQTRFEDLGGEDRPCVA